MCTKLAILRAHSEYKNDIKTGEGDRLCTPFTTVILFTDEQCGEIYLPLLHHGKGKWRKKPVHSVEPARNIRFIASLPIRVTGLDPARQQPTVNITRANHPVNLLLPAVMWAVLYWLSCPVLIYDTKCIKS